MNVGRVSEALHELQLEFDSRRLLALLALTRGGLDVGRHTPVGCSSPAKRPSLDEQRAAQLTLSSLLGKEDRGRERE